MIRIMDEFIHPVRLYPPARSTGALRITTRKDCHNPSAPERQRSPTYTPAISLVFTSKANSFHRLLPLLLTNDHISSHWMVKRPFFRTNIYLPGNSIVFSIDIRL
jgi:hypothetical protein